MKLLERTHLRRTEPHVAETEGHEALERLEVPDDLSGLVELPDHEPRRAASMVRWLRWAPVALLAIFGVVGVAMLLNNDGGTDLDIPTVEAPDWETEGPGSNSLHALWLTKTQVPWGPNEGPGGTTMNQELVAPVVGLAPTWETHGPSGHLPDMTWTPDIEAPDWETEGPGSNSL